MNNKQKIIVDYIPHGIDHNIFKPIDETDEEYKNFLNQFYNLKYDNYNFILFYNNRNIKRKMPGDVMLAFATFARELPKEQKDKVLLLMHTHIVDEAGTDLNALKNDLFSDVNILFSTKKYEPKILNYIYNSVDVTINLANNEGYGLATAESLMSGIPIIATVTGGLQDQMGFEGVLNQENFNIPEKRNSKYGTWVYPIYPAARCLQGSPLTPYIFADYINYFDAAKGIKYWYVMKMNNYNQMKKIGLEGRKYMIEQGHTFDSMIDSFDKVLNLIGDNFEPRQKVFIEKC